MQVVSLTERELGKLPILQLSNKVINTEGKLYIYDHKDKWNHLTELLKIYYRQTDEYLSEKIYTVSQLLANSELIDIPELVLPTALVAVNRNLAGFSMPFIQNNVNLALLLTNPKVKLSKKIEYLTEIWQILERISRIKELEGKFFLGDIHEANFILDIDEQVIRAVDMDSAYINESSIYPSKFLAGNTNLKDNPKYPYSTKHDLPMPNQNITILCFMYMLINALSNSTRSYRWSMNEFYNYLSFLRTQGVPNEVVDAILNIYVPNKPNEFDIEMLDAIDTTKDYTVKLARVHKTDSNDYYHY